MVILFEQLIELSQQIGVDVSEKSLHNLNSLRMDLSLQSLNEVFNFFMSSSKSNFKDFFRIEGDIF